MPATRPVRPATGVALALPRVGDETTQRAFDRITIASQQLVSRIGAVDTSVTDLAAAIPSLMWVNVATFGARGNGIADDTAAIQAALDASEGEQAVVYMPTGVHVISDTLYVPNKVVLVGVGRGDAGKLQASASFPIDGRAMVRLGRTTEPLVFGCRVERVIIDCNSVAKVGVFSSAANEQSGVRFCTVTNFTQYGIHFSAASIFSIENVEVLPDAVGATTGIYLQSCAGDNLVARATIGVSGLLANGLHIQSTQCIAQGIHVENCTVGVRLDACSSVLIGVSGPTVTVNVPDLVLAQGNTRYNVALNLVKNSATRTVTDSFAGYVNSDPFLPIWMGGEAVAGNTFQVIGNLGFYGTAVQSKQTVTGSRGGNAALASLLTALATYGLITDGTTP